MLAAQENLPPEPKAGTKTLPLHFPAAQPWTGRSVTVGLGFLICKVGIAIFTVHGCFLD